MSALRVASPEQELLFAAVKLAIEDLQSNEEEVKYEAHQFLFQRSGGWADMRRHYFDLLGLDEESVQANIAHICDPPERPEKKWTMLEVYEVLPGTPFNSKTIGNMVGLRYSQITARFQHLMRMELIVRVGRGMFIRADCLEVWKAKELDALAPEPDLGPQPTQRSQVQLLDVLRGGPKTMRELVFAFDGDLGQDAIRQRLARAQSRGLIEKSGPTWVIAA